MERFLERFWNIEDNKAEDILKWNIHVNTCIRLRMNFLRVADIERIKSHKREVIMDHFELVSEYKPTGDQPQAIEKLVKGFKEGNQCETLLGVTGSGKTFTMANIIQQLNKPTLILAHNKTLAAQLYGEFKEFFPNNAVEYFVS